VSFHKSGHVIDDPANLTANLKVQSVKTAAVSPVRLGWITLTVPNRHYDRNHMCIEVHVRSRTIRNHREDLCAVFNFVTAIDWRPRCSRLRLSDKLDLAFLDTSEGHLEQSVLVPVIEIVKDAQERREGWMRAVVRLRSLDSCPNWIADRSKLLDGSVVEGRAAFLNGKHERLFLGGRIGRGLMASDSIDKMVKSISEIRESIRNDKRPSLKGRRFVNAQKKTVTGAVRACLLKDAVRVSVYPSQDFIVDGLGVLLASG
jgi:hypothetical protein